MSGAATRPANEAAGEAGRGYPALRRPLLLASGSETRRALLLAAGLPHRVRPARVDEDAIKAAMTQDGASPLDVARALARAKALWGAPHPPETERGTAILAADQVLELDGETWSKAGSRAGAHEQLRRLSGRTHALHSAFAVAMAPAEAPSAPLAHPGGEGDGQPSGAEASPPPVELVAEGVDTARLTMRALTDAEIERYLDAVEARDGPGAFSSVGCYRLEDIGLHLFEHVEGAHSTILGLPMLPLLAALRRLGVIG